MLRILLLSMPHDAKLIKILILIFSLDLVVAVMVLVAITKACIKVTFTVGYIYTAELFPTPVRHLAVGSSSMMSRLGGILAPFVGGPLVSIAVFPW